MAIVFEDWLARNAQRAYPLHDLATRQGESELYLPDDIFTDIRISVPESVGKSIYISSVGITSSLVSATFLATPNNPLETGGPAPGTPVAIAAVRVARPLTPYKNYAIEALYPGVSGWVSFGAGANKHEMHMLFNDPEATWLCGRCVRQAKELPVTAAGKLGLAARLKGLVRLSGTDSISITKEQRTVNGVEQDVLVFALKVPTNSTLQEILRLFAEPCDNRPSEETCLSPGLVSINQVEPDRDGNISLVFSQGREIIGDSGDGMVLDYPLGLSNVCPPKNYDPYDPDDICEPSESSSSSSESSESSSSEGPEPAESSSSSSFCDSLSSELGPLLQEVSGEGLGTWKFDVGETGDTRLITEEGQLVHHIVNTVDRFRAITNGEETVVSGIVRPTQTPSGEGHLIFGYKSVNNFFFGGMTLRPSAAYPGGRFFIGRKASGGPSWPNGLGLGYNFLAGGSFLPPIALAEVDYDISLEIIRVSQTTATVRLLATWTDLALGAQAYTSPYVPILGTDMWNFRVGMGAVLSPKTEFADWCVHGWRIYSS